MIYTIFTFVKKVIILNKKRLTREESKQKTRNELLQVASKMFAKKGFHDTSVDQIAEEAGYSKGAVYSNFGSKEDLFLSVFSENQKKDLQKFEEIAGEYHSLDDFIKMIDKNHQVERKENRDWGMLKLEFLLYAMREESVRKKLAPLLEETRSQLMHILDTFGEVDTKNNSISVESLAFLILALDIGVGIQYYADEKSPLDNVLAEGLRRLLK